MYSLIFEIEVTSITDIMNDDELINFPGQVEFSLHLTP